MSTLNVKVPDSLLKQAEEIAQKEDITLEQLVSSALAEKVAAWKTLEYLEKRGARGDRQKFLRAMGRVPDVEPEDRDRL